MDLDWIHDGVDLDRFEILFRPAGSSGSFTRYLLAPASSFGPGPYGATVVSTEDLEWVVRALNAGTAVSAANSTVTFDESIDGVWLIPHRVGRPLSDSEVFIAANPPDLHADVASEEFDLPNRREILSQDGVFHLDRGSIEDAPLLSKHGETAATWRQRLENLIGSQRSYGHVLLVCPWYEPFRVRIRDLSKRPAHLAGIRTFRVSFSFRQVL